MRSKRPTKAGLRKKLSAPSVPLRRKRVSKTALEAMWDDVINEIMGEPVIPNAAPFKPGFKKTPKLTSSSKTKTARARKSVRKPK